MEAELPEDVIEEILIRLPIESLVKFRTVSKQWLRLITSSRFAFKQHQVRIFDDPTSSSIINSKEFVDIWVMREYGVEDSWTKEFTVGPIPMDMLVLGFSSKARAIFLRPTSNISPQLILFHGNSSKAKRHRPKGEDINQYMQVVEYTKSLISVSE
ncbi:hypothetical protein QQ045_002423 [Rhodiola kirilowii]